MTATTTGRTVAKEAGVEMRRAFGLPTATASRAVRFVGISVQLEDDPLDADSALQHLNAVIIISTELVVPVARSQEVLFTPKQEGGDD